MAVRLGHGADPTPYTQPRNSSSALLLALRSYTHALQVKKRAGQIIPEIRPNAGDIGERSARLLPAIEVDATEVPCHEHPDDLR